MRNQAGVRPLGAGEQAFPVYTLHRTSLISFEADAKASRRGSLGRAGCVVAFRKEASDAEPFGMWFGWIMCSGHLFVVDLQNSTVKPTLAASIAGLGWAQAPRAEVFYAPFK